MAAVNEDRFLDTGRKEGELISGEKAMIIVSGG